MISRILLEDPNRSSEVQNIPVLIAQHFLTLPCEEKSMTEGKQSLSFTGPQKLIIQEKEKVGKKHSLTFSTPCNLFLSPAGQDSAELNIDHF